MRDRTATMKAAVLLGHGGPDQLEIRDDVPVASPGPADVLIEVAACGVNNTDLNTRIGWYAGGSWGGGIDFPRIQGADPVGRVAAVGEEVSVDLLGQRVLVDPWLRAGRLEDARYLGSEVDGGFAEYVAVPATNAHPIASDLSDVELATFPCSYSTAEHMLERAGVVAEQWVLISGASGGVGSALVQLAKRRGANVIALTSTSKFEAISGLGADVVLDRTADDLAEAVARVAGAVDVFADVVGGEMFAPLLETVKWGGHYAAAGAIGGPVVPLDLRTLYLHDLTMHGATVVPPYVFSNLVRYIEAGEVSPVLASTFPLDEIQRAQEVFSRKEHVGAFVIEIGL